MLIFFFNNNRSIIVENFPSRRLIARIKMIKNRSCPLIMMNSNWSNSFSYDVNSLDESWLWHLRYSNLHFAELNLLL